MELASAVTPLAIYRISLVFASVVFAGLGYMLLSRGLTLREGDGNAVKVTSGIIFSLFGMGVLLATLLNPVSMRVQDLPGFEVIASAPAKIEQLEQQVRDIRSKLGEFRPEQIASLEREVKAIKTEVQGTKSRLEQLPKPAELVEGKPVAGVSQAGDTEERPLTGEPAELTIKNMRVVGILESEGKRSALAQDNAGVGYILRPGDPIRDGKVVAVTEDGVLLERATGERATIKLPGR